MGARKKQNRKVGAEARKTEKQQHQQKHQRSGSSRHIGDADKLQRLHQIRAIINIVLRFFLSLSFKFHTCCVRHLAQRTYTSHTLYEHPNIFDVV